MEIPLAWADFKNLVKTWNVKKLIRFTPKDAVGNYREIWVNFEGIVFYLTGNPCLSVDDTLDISDFEANYLPNTVTTWVLGLPYTRNDIADTFPITASQTTTHDLKITANSEIWGGDLIIPGVLSIDNDYVQVQVVDNDGILPGNTKGTTVVIQTLINKKFISGTNRFISASSPDNTAFLTPGGLYLRFNYTEVGGVPGKQGNINLITRS